jgi:DNA ligase (NAD+)
MITNEDEILFEKLQKSADNYYANGTSELSDEEYDQIYDYLKLKYSSHDFFRSVGSSEKGEHWKKVNHEYKMGSLNKVNTIEEMNQWIIKQSEREFIIEEKLDGISILLIYDNGVLISASTRGDGEQGENILRNVKRMKGVPSTIGYKDLKAIRAEIIMTHSDFNKLPKELEAKNPRNITAGIAKRLDGKYCNYLTVICTEFMSSETDRSEALVYLEYLGFIVVQSYDSIITPVEHLYNSYIRERRDLLDYDIDGLVIKTNKVLKEKEDDWSHPKHQIAFKFPNQYKATYLREVVWQYKGNRISPVGIVDPVQLAGATVTRVSLNNIDFINDLKLKINSKVEITRANEVIPKIQSVLEEGDKEIEMPTKCPTCNSNVIQDGKFFYCSNEECSSKTVRKILKWLQAHDAKGIAQSTIESLFEEQMFQDLPMFLDYKLWLDYVKDLEGFGSRKAEIIKTEIDKTLHTTILKFMDALDFTDMGERKWKAILDYFAEKYIGENITIEMFLSLLKTYELMLIEGIAEETKRKIKDSLKDKEELINDLLTIVKVEDYKKETNMSGELSGMSFCFTGKLETMKRPEAQKLVEENGGINKSGVSNDLTYLVTNDSTSGSAKNKDAEQKGVKLINEEQFLKMIK